MYIHIHFTDTYIYIYIKIYVCVFLHIQYHLFFFGHRLLWTISRAKTTSQFLILVQSQDDLHLAWINIFIGFELALLGKLVFPSHSKQVKAVKNRKTFSRMKLNQPWLSYGLCGWSLISHDLCGQVITNWKYYTCIKYICRHYNLEITV